MARSSTFVRNLACGTLAFVLGASSAVANQPLKLQAERPQVRLSDLEAANDSILDDVYVRLYLARLRRARITIEKEKEELSVVMKRRDRIEILYNKRAVQPEELELARKAVEVAALRVQEAEAMAEEAQTFVEIAVSRISLGLEMPICAEIR